VRNPGPASVISVKEGTRIRPSEGDGVISIVDTCVLIDLIREGPGAMRLAEDEQDLSSPAIPLDRHLSRAPADRYPNPGPASPRATDP